MRHVIPSLVILQRSLDDQALRSGSSEPEPLSIQEGRTQCCASWRDSVRS